MSNPPRRESFWQDGNGVRYQVQGVIHDSVVLERRPGNDLVEVPLTQWPGAYKPATTTSARPQVRILLAGGEVGAWHSNICRKIAAAAQPLGLDVEVLHWRQNLRMTPQIPSGTEMVVILSDHIDHVTSNAASSKARVAGIECVFVSSQQLTAKVEAGLRRAVPHKIQERVGGLAAPAITLYTYDETSEAYEYVENQEPKKTSSGFWGFALLVALVGMPFAIFRRR